MEHLRHMRLMTLGVLALGLTGCANLFGGLERRQHGASSPLVEFLYADGEIPPVAAEVHLTLPIRVGVTFLPSTGRAGPSAVEREKVLAAIRENFKSRPYVSEIVPIPNYYLSMHGRDGLTQIEQVSRLNQLDLFALVSWDQVTDSTVNKSSLAYLTIVGAYFVRGDRHETHTLLDLAVIDPRTRSLVVRSGGTSSLAGNTTLIEAGHHETAQRTRGFELATASLVDNFKRELTEFEGRVREGSAPVKVTRRASGGGGGGGGGGALDPALLSFLAASLLLGAYRARRAVHSRSGA
jgi:rhombotail lipoprotein